MLPVHYDVSNVSIGAMDSALSAWQILLSYLTLSRLPGRSKIIKLSITEPRS